MEIDQILTITPTELVAGGNALAKVDGFPIFAANLFPGDTARVRLFEVKKGFAKAELVELLEPGPLRRAAPCPVADECGGCDWTALRLDHQLAAKRRILSESLRRIGKLQPETLPPIRVHSSPLNYRLRSRLHRDGDAVGFYAMRSNRVVPLPAECEVVGLQTARHPEEGETWELDGTLIRDGREIAISAGDYRWRLSTEAFFQVNRHLLGTMVRRVEELASSVRQRLTALDLYAGVGFFTLPIARHFERVVAVEGSRRSAHYGRMNAPRNTRIVEAPVEQEIRRLPEADLVFLDPPRAGARQEVIEWIGSRTRERIAYLSCDPVTFARDAGRLTASGWRLSTLDLLDLFPNTHHVETLSSFERAQ